jgi:hypothetical protein
MKFYDKDISFYEHPLFGISISTVFHLILLSVLIILSQISLFQPSGKRNQYIEAFPFQLSSKSDKFNISTNNLEQSKETANNLKTKTGEDLSNTSKGNIDIGSALFGSSDTSNLENYYSETTLNVRIKYPSGWTYIDQNVKNKLDGVTFLGIQIDNLTPPYIHLEVKDKYLFNASKFKYKSDMKNYTAYFNDPIELEGQYSQEIYIRTKDEEDYSIKIIITGKDAFYKYQPVFFGMIKTFKFGSSIF